MPKKKPSDELRQVIEPARSRASITGAAPVTRYSTSFFRIPSKLSFALLFIGTIVATVFITRYVTAWKIHKGLTTGTLGVSCVETEKPE